MEGETFPYSQVRGFDETYRIKAVSIENLVIHGVKVNSTYNGMIKTVHAYELIFK